MLLALAVAGIAVDAETREVALRGLDRRLLAEAEALAGLVQFDGSTVSIERPEDAAPEYRKPSGRAYFQIWTGSREVARSRSLGEHRLPPPDQESMGVLETLRSRRTGRDFVIGPRGDRMRMQTLVVARGSSNDRRVPPAIVAIQVARELDDVAHAVAEVRADQWVALPLAWVVGCAGVFLLATRALRPIARMSRDAGAIAAGKLDRRLDITSVDDELTDLASTLNAAFGRMAGAVDRERRFADDAAHELRTPLTVLRTSVELALLKDRTVPEYVDALKDAQRSTERLGRVVEDLLLLARVEHARPFTEHVDVRSAVLASVDAAWFVGQNRAPPIRLELDPDELPVFGSVVLIERVVANLIENARAHGASPHGIDVSALRSADGLFAEIIVADRGPGIPQELVPRLFERFARGDLSRSRMSGGNGLGLAIVLGIVRALGGDADVRPRVGGGTECRVRLPLSRADSRVNTP
ncbi:MAG: sensor histidine kinase N-terminal domain-containing protein [Planctomycetes bacterium]|nr:sensor histidine kinase N-terminal domain-containing protein [Planctomycetota bacterium]